MTERDEFIGRVEGYLDDYEGYTPLPESIRDAVRASIPSIRQVGPRPGPAQVLDMTMAVPGPARWGLVAAAVMAIVVLGATLFGSGGGIGGPDASDEPSPTPLVTPTPVPTAAGPRALLSMPVGANLPAGEYHLDVDAYPALIELTVPEGWWYWFDSIRGGEYDVHAILVDSEDTGAANGSAWGLAFAVAGEVRVDPCDPDAGSMDPSVLESAESLATAFSSWADYPAIGVEDVTIGGYSGKRVEIATDQSPCLGWLFTTPRDYRFEVQRNRPATPQQPEQFTLLDVEGSVLVIWTTDYPDTNYYEMDGGAPFTPDAHAEDQVALRAILDSIVIVPRE